MRAQQKSYDWLSLGVTHLCCVDKNERDYLNHF